MNQKSNSPPFLYRLRVIKSFLRIRFIRKLVMCGSLMVMPAFAAGTGSGFELLHESALGQWTLDRDVNSPGFSCSITFRENKSKGTALGFVGPNANSPSGAIVFTGPKIPKATESKTTTARLETEGDPPQTVRAMHFQGPAGLGGLAVVTEMKSTVSAIDDQESVRLKIGSQTVFELSYDGGHQARDAMLACMSAGRSNQDVEKTRNSQAPRK